MISVYPKKAFSTIASDTGQGGLSHTRHRRKVTPPPRRTWNTRRRVSVAKRSFGEPCPLVFDGGHATQLWITAPTLAIVVSH